MQHLSQHVIDADTFARLFKEFPKVFETFSFDEKRNLILLLVKEVIYMPTKVRVLFWGDIPEMNFDLKTPPDWTPPPDDGDTPYTPKGSGGSSVEAPVRTRYLVRTGVLNGSPKHTPQRPFFEVEFPISLYRVTKGAWKIGAPDRPHSTSSWPLKSALMAAGPLPSPEV